MEQIEKRTHEAITFVYRTKVRNWKRKKAFTEDKQEEAMQEVIGRVHKFHPDAKPDMIRMISEERLLEIKALMRQSNSSQKAGYKRYE